MQPEHLQFRLESYSSSLHLYPASASVQIESAGLLVCDENTLHIVESLGLARHESLVVLPAGESHKALPAVETILQAAVDRGLSRSSTMVGVGGGVITDLVGFAASVYMRGCKLVLVPTSLLAMVDAAFGGKTGINYAGFKNMVGTFYPASDIYIIPDVLSSLPEIEYHSGLGETIKNALLGDEHLLQLIETETAAIKSRDSETLAEVIRRGVLVKCRIVEQDLTETGIRAHLNLGHTFAHALESVAGFGRWTHGEAVAWGIAKALRLGEKLGITPPEYRDRIESLLIGYGFRLAAEANHDRLIDAMWHDKKLKDGRLYFVLQSGIGQTHLVPVEQDQVRAVL